MSFLLRKSFCSWLCPVGTLSEYLWKLGRSTFRRNFTLPRWLDIPLRSLKYLLLGFFAYAVFSMSAAAIAEFLATPYGLIVDVRMLNFFRYLGGTPLSSFSAWSSRRFSCRTSGAAISVPTGRSRTGGAGQSAAHHSHESTCIDCAKCAKACPAALAGRQAGADSLRRVHRMPGMCRGLSRERRAGHCRSTKARRPAWSMAAGIAIIFFGLVGYAKLSGHWDTHLPKQIYFELVPTASAQQHPAPGE